MVRFMLMHLQEGRLDGRHVLAPETVAGMHERRFGNHPAVDGLGYMFLEENRGDTRIIKHGGRLRGATSVMALFPERDLGVFVAYNTTGGPDASEALFDEFVAEYAPPGEPEPVEPEGLPARADAIAGWYRFTRVPESPMKPIFGVGGTVEVRVASDGTLVTAPTAPGVDPIRWTEVEPLVFRAVGDSPQVSRYSHLAFREEAGEITYVFFRGPTGSYRRLAGYEHPWLHLAVVVAFLVALVSAVGGWSGAAVRRRVTGRPSPPPRPRAARWLAGITAAVLVGAPVGLIAALAGGAVDLTYGLTWWFTAVLALPVVGAMGAVATLGVTALAWRDGYWGVPGRVHYTLLAVAAGAFAGLMAYWQVMWLPF